MQCFSFFSFPFPLPPLFRSKNLVYTDSLENDSYCLNNTISWFQGFVQTMGTSCFSCLIYPFHAARQVWREFFFFASSPPNFLSVRKFSSSRVKHLLLVQATIPSIEWNEHSKLRLVLSSFFCPLLVLIPLDPIVHSQEQVVPLMPSKGIYVPLWSFVAMDSCFLAALVAIVTTNKTSDRSSVGSSLQNSNSTQHLGFVHWGSCCCAFVMSILWISGHGTTRCFRFQV